MVTREQMDTLSSRVGNVLELVGDLRIENSQLAAEVEQLKTRHDQSERKIEEQAKESKRLREQLEERNQKLNEMIVREEEFENYMLQLIGQVDHVKLADFQNQFAELSQKKIDGEFQAPESGETGDPLEVLEVAYDSDKISVNQSELVDIDDAGNFDVTEENTTEIFLDEQGDLQRL
ncbi:MAG: hypothetical protein NXI24_18160 [bacterium]|nr:hypothetical protein [bacterium]